MNKSLFVLAIICLYFLSASAKSKDMQKCKICDGRGQRDYGICKDDTDEGIDTECSKEKHVSCYKRVYASGSIERGCTDIDKEICETEIKNGKQIETCFCRGNLCNGAQSTDISHKSLLLGVISIAVASMLV